MLGVTKIATLPVRVAWKDGRLGDAPLPIRRDGFAARKRRGCFGAMRSAGEKDGSDPISTRRHFAERLDGTGKM